MALLQLVDKYATYSTTEVSCTSTYSTFIDDSQATLSFTTTQNYVALVIYSASSIANGTADDIYGIWNAVNVNGTDYAHSKHIGARGGNTCFWIGNLSSGSHTIKGRIARQNTSGTVYVGQRALLCYLFTGDEWGWTENTTEVSTSSLSLVDDSYASFTFTPSAQCKILTLYNTMNLDTTNNDRRECSINFAGSDTGVINQHFNAQATGFNCSQFVSYVGSRTASSTTIKGRYRAWLNTYYGIISRRQFGYLCLSDNVSISSVINDTTASTTSVYPVDDPQVSLSLTPSQQVEWLCLATRSGIYGSQNSTITQDGQYGIKLGTTVKNTSYRATDIINYPIGTTVIYGETLDAGSYTLKTVYGVISSGTSMINHRHVMSLLIPKVEPKTSSLFTFHG